MRRLGSGGVTAALIVGLGAAVAAAEGGADNDVAAPVGNGLLSGLFHEKPRSQAKTDPKAGEVKLPPASSIESTEAERQRYVNAWIRRVEVCDRLRMIAEQTGNETLGNQAAELEERANAIYRLQTSRLPLPAQAPLSVLAADREDPNRDRNIKQASIDQPAGPGGSADQWEQAVLNGTSRGEK